MPVIKVTAFTKQAERKVRRIQKAISLDQIDKIVAEVSAVVIRWLIQATPKQEGTARRSWTILSPKAARREILNKAKIKTATRGEVPVLQLLGEGTGIYGPSASKIVSPFGNSMFIPLNQRASSTGWRPGLRYGVDYVFAKSTKGIKTNKSRQPVKTVKPRAEKLLAKRISTHLKRAIRE